MEDIKLAMTIPFKPEQWTFTEMEDKVSRPSMESINASLKQKGINVDFFHQALLFLVSKRNVH